MRLFFVIFTTRLSSKIIFNHMNNNTLITLWKSHNSQFATSLLRFKYEHFQLYVINYTLKFDSDKRFRSVFLFFQLWILSYKYYLILVFLFRFHTLTIIFCKNESMNFLCFSWVSLDFIFLIFFCCCSYFSFHLIEINISLNTLVCHIFQLMGLFFLQCI